MPTDEEIEAAVVEGAAGEADKSEKKEEAKASAMPPEILKTVEELRLENAKLRELTERSFKDAESAKSYVQQLIGQMQNAAAQTAMPTVDELKQRFEENPQAVLDEHFRARMEPLAATYLQNQANLNRQLASERYASKSWGRFEKEVDEFMSGIPLETRAQPGSYEQAFNFVRAKHLDELIQEAATGKATADKAAFTERPTGNAGHVKTKTELGDVEKAVAKGLGLTEDEYTKWKEA